MSQDFLAKLTQPGGWGVGLPGFHLAISWFAFWPGSLLLGLAVPWIWARRQEPAVRLCLALSLPAWAIFELVATKLAHYTLPLYPALAALAAAAAVDGWQAVKTSFAGKAWRGLVWILWAGAGMAILGGGLLLTRSLGTPDLMRLHVLTHITALAALATGAALLMRHRAMAGAVSLTLASLALWPAWLGFTLPQMSSLWIAPRVAAMVAAQPSCPGRMVISSGKGFAEPSLAFALDGHVRMADNPAQAADLFIAQPCSFALTPAEDADAFALASRAHGGLPPQAIGQVSGFNYGRGKAVKLTLWRHPQEETP